MGAVALLLGQPVRGTRIARKLDKAGIEAAVLIDATLKEALSATAELTQHPVEDGPDISDHIILKPQRLTITGIVTETPFSVKGQIAGVAASVASAIGSKLGNAVSGVTGGIGSAPLGAASALVAGKTLAGLLAPPSVTNQKINDSESDFRSASALPGDNVRLRDATYEFLRIRDSRMPVSIVTGLKRYENYVLVDFSVSRDATAGKQISVTLVFQEVLFVTTNQTVGLPAIKQALPKKVSGTKNGSPVTGAKEESGSTAYEILHGLGG